jgi:hypothetical protein
MGKERQPIHGVVLVVEKDKSTGNNPPALDNNDDDNDDDAQIVGCIICQSNPESKCLDEDLLENEIRKPKPTSILSSLDIFGFSESAEAEVRVGWMDGTFCVISPTRVPVLFCQTINSPNTFTSFLCLDCLYIDLGYRFKL